MPTNRRRTQSFTNHVTISWSLRSTFPSSSSAMVMGQWYHTTPSLVDVTILVIFSFSFLSRAIYACRRGHSTRRSQSGARLNHGIRLMELPGLDLICTKKPGTSAHTDSCPNEPLPTPHSPDLIVGLTSMHNLFLLFQNYSLCSFSLIHLKNKKTPSSPNLPC